MPATRSSSRISAASAEASAAPINRPTPNNALVPEGDLTASGNGNEADEDEEDEDDEGRKNRDVGRVRPEPYKVKNRLPFPGGDLFFDIGGLGSGSMGGTSPCPEGGEGYPVARLPCKIYLRDPKTGSKTKIGRINARLIQKYPDRGTDFHIMCDDLSAELEAMSTALFDHETEDLKGDFWDWLGDIMYIEEIFVKERYRGYGIGLLAVDYLISQIPSFAQLVVILAPCPFNPSGFGQDQFEDSLARDRSTALQGLEPSLCITSGSASRG